MKGIKMYLVLVMALILTSSVWGEVPHVMNFQGLLTDDSGNAVVNQIKTMSFKIYDTATNGTAKWQEIQYVQTDSKGLFNVVLGANIPIADSVFDDTGLYLAVAINFIELSPRTPLASVAYANRVSSIDGAASGKLVGQLVIAGDTSTQLAAGPLSSHDDPFLQVGEKSLPGCPWPPGKIEVTNGCEVAIALDGATGRVGIGTGDPTARLQVNAGNEQSGIFLNNKSAVGAGVEAATVKVQNDNPDGIALFAQSNTTDAAVVVTNTNATGLVIKCFGENFTEAFKVSAKGRATTAVLEITGGSDLSEQFDISTHSGELQPGMVVSIDPEHPGELALSCRSYDRRVAGIISGAGGINTGMLMGQSGSLADGKYPIALTGRVYCWADASNGPIQPGDLLTTSDTPGHAMKVTDHAQAQGAIIGKAMTRLEQGKGLVLVLVTLQ